MKNFPQTVEGVTLSKEFAIVIRETLTCSGFMMDHLQNVFDKLRKPDQMAILYTLQSNQKQRLYDLGDTDDLGERMALLIIEIRKYLK